MIIYRVNTLEAYRADECGIRFSLNEPVDTIDYKHEYKKIEIELPEGFRVVNYDSGWSAIVYNEYDVLIGEDSNGIYLEVCCLEPKKFYPRIINK